ncbi:hypothetical protein ACEWY4_021509 [Coilia grayii]|uniref:Integrase catalytic domain-containing protein n=1 Tax=Coilia grayii TaxID=363190 RepID=A0ABD1JCD6_9TELE
MPGRANTVADLLSRAVSLTKEAGAVPSDMDCDEDLVHILHEPLSSVVTLEELQQASAEDDTPCPCLRPERLANQDSDVEELVRNCSCCLLSGKTGQPATAPLTPTPWPSTPWEHLQVDLCGELHGAPAHARYLLVVHDLHSKWPEVFPLTSITSHTIISRLFGRWGLPSAITTDNGAQFTSAEFTEFLALRSIKHIRTAVYHPESNGGVERLNKTLKDGLTACLAEGKTFRAVGWPRRPAANGAANPPSPEAPASPTRAQPTQPPDMATSPAHPQGLRAQPAQTPDVAAQPASQPSAIEGPARPTS